ncbi:MAG: hypothetical protein QOF60_1068 [Actinomycetota bacterium]|jgi:hypothetical protein|nr:hypothetical protein [Actinomycetota bacterium]
MANIAFRATSDLLDAAKQAALDAVAGYGQLTPYTVGIAVQAAAAVLRADLATAPAALAERDAWDVDSTEVGEVDRQQLAA